MQFSWDISEIRGMNPLQPDQRRSQLDHLISVAAASEDTLCSLAEFHENTEQDCALCVFQLPFALQTSQAQIMLPSRSESVSLNAFIRRQFLNSDIRGTVWVSDEPTDNSDVWSRQISQVVFQVPVWGKRALFYDAYAARISSSGVKNEVIVPAHESWIMDRALSTKDFEYNLVRRMLKEALYAARILLKSIRITTLFHCDHDYNFSGMYWMPCPGRITYTQPPRPIVSELMTRRAEDAETVDVPDLSNAIANRHREVSKFERSLMSFEQLRLQGEAKAALMGLVAVIEATLKEYFDAKRINLSKLLSDKRLQVLTADDRQVLDDMRIARNAVVHEYMSTEISSGRSFLTAQDRKALNSELDELCQRGMTACRSVFRTLNQNR